jgi:endoglucanase
VTRLGRGTAIKIMDSSVVCDFRIVDALRDVAERKRIPHQLEVLPKGGTDTAAIQRAGQGAPAGCISIPCRYVHSVTEMCHKKDIQASIDLLAAFLAEAHGVALDRE